MVSHNIFNYVVLYTEVFMDKYVPKTPNLGPRHLRIGPRNGSGYVVNRLPKYLEISLGGISRHLPRDEVSFKAVGVLSTSCYCAERIA